MEKSENTDPVFYQRINGMIAYDAFRRGLRKDPSQKKGLNGYYQALFSAVFGLELEQGPWNPPLLRRDYRHGFPGRKAE